MNNIHPVTLSINKMPTALGKVLTKVNLLNSLYSEKTMLTMNAVFSLKTKPMVRCVRVSTIWQFLIAYTVFAEYIVCSVNEYPYFHHLIRLTF